MLNKIFFVDLGGDAKTRRVWFSLSHSAPLLRFQIMKLSRISDPFSVCLPRYFIGQCECMRAVIPDVKNHVRAGVIGLRHSPNKPLYIQLFLRVFPIPRKKKNIRAQKSCEKIGRGGWGSCNRSGKFFNPYNLSFLFTYPGKLSANKSFWQFLYCSRFPFPPPILFLSIYLF